jgi:AcrR family transcriptional regulator
MPKIVDHDRYRDELAYRSFDIVAKHGFQIPTRDLAKRLGISTGTIYKYFKSKRHLFEYMTQVMTKRNVAEIIIDIKDDTPLEERVNIVRNFLIKNQTYLQNLLMLAFDYMRYDKQSTMLKKGLDNFRIAIADYFTVDDEYGKFIFIYLCGLIFHGILFPKITSIPKQAEAFKQFIVPPVKSMKK